MNSYYETLGSVVEAIGCHAEVSKALLVDGWAEKFEVGYSVNYGATVSENFELASLRGRPTRKWLHASIYRLESGRYELTCYIL